MGSGGTLTLSSGRGFMIFANTLTMIAGLILIGLGLYGVFSSEVRLYSSEIPIATIVLGFLVLLISITGCCGAFVENRPILVIVSFYKLYCSRVFKKYWLTSFLVFYHAFNFDYSANHHCDRCIG
jgi:hypothetical protein